MDIAKQKEVNMTKKIDPKDISRKQFKKLPKTDLHVHLDGFVPPSCSPTCGRTKD